MVAPPRSPTAAGAERAARGHLDPPLVERAAKRALDLLLATVGLVVAAPLFPLVALAIKLESPGPVLFRHPRLGRGGRRIVVTKLRTMRAGAPDAFAGDGSRVPVRTGDPRVTRVGAFLRGGLDELPQLVGVVRGTLSVVGPRPDDLYALDLYRGVEWNKLAVKPGITGLAAVSGRNDIPWRERLLYEVYYAHHQDLGLDLRIVVKQIAVALGLATPGGVVSWEDVQRFAASETARAAGERVELEVRAHRADAP